MNIPYIVFDFKAFRNKVRGMVIRGTVVRGMVASRYGRFEVRSLRGTAIRGRSFEVWSFEIQSTCPQRLTVFETLFRVSVLLKKGFIILAIISYTTIFFKALRLWRNV
jgi:hypothetical protein